MWPFRTPPPPAPLSRKFYVTYHVASPTSPAHAVGSKVVTLSGPLSEAVIERLVEIIDGEPAITVPRPRVVLVTGIIPLEA